MAGLSWWACTGCGGGAEAIGADLEFVAEQAAEAAPPGAEAEKNLLLLGRLVRQPNAHGEPKGKQEAPVARVKAAEPTGPAEAAPDGGQAVCAEACVGACAGAGGQASDGPAGCAPEAAAEEKAQEALASDLAPELRLCEEDARAVRALQAELGEEALVAVRATLVPGESLESCLLRFLRRHGARPSAAAKALRAHLTWREVTCPALLADQAPEEIAGCAPELLNRYLPTWHQGFDRLGRPVVFSHYGKFRFKPMVQAGVSVEKILKLHIRNSERTARLCGRQSQKLGRDISAALIIMDTEGWDSQNAMTRAAFEWVRGLVKIDQDHYAERMGQLLIINAPPSVHNFYKGLAWALPDKPRQQVRIFSGKEHWLPALLELVDAEQLPPEYGGCGAPLSLLAA